MESLYILIPIAICFVFVAIGIFIWAVKTDQFDDLERQGMSIFFDEKAQIMQSKKANSNKRKS